jgi:hypothetical protein
MHALQNECSAALTPKLLVGVIENVGRGVDVGEGLQLRWMGEDLLMSGRMNLGIRTGAT